MTLNKRIKRNVRQNRSFYIISTILTMLTSAFIIAAVSTGTTLTRIIADFMEQYHTEDAEFTTYLPISEEEMEQLERNYHLLLEENDYKDVTLEDGTVIRFFVPMEQVNLSEVRNGALPVNDQEALITQNYAENHGIAVGDSYQAGEYSFRITGYFTKADYIYMLESLADTYRDNQTFALMNVTREAYDRIDADEIRSYAVIYQDDNEMEFRKAIHEDYIISSYLSKDSDTRISVPENEGEGVTNMARNFAPVLFLIVVALVVMILGRMIKREQSLIGTFLALGIRKREIVSHYTKYALIPGVIGSVLGLLLSIPFTHAFSKFYIDNDYEKMSYSVTYNLPSVLVALVIPSLLYFLTAAIVAHRLLKKSAIELLNHTGKEGKSIGILKTKRMRIAGKLRIRSVIGHPGRSVVTLVGVMIAAVCLLLGFIMYDSLTHLMKDGLKETIHYEYLYALNYLGTEELPDGAEDGEPMLRIYYEVSGSTQQLNVQGIEMGSDLYPTVTVDGEIMDGDRYYLTSAGAATYGVGKGDTLTFYNIADLEEHKIEIAGIAEDNLHCYLYTSRENASKLAGFDQPVYNMLVSKKALHIDEDLVVSTTNMTEHGDTLSDLMGPILAIVYIVVILGAVLCLFIMYLVINMIIGEGQTTISVMKVLGFSRQEISSRILNVNHILIVFGFLLAIPLSYQVAKAGFADTIEEYGMYFAPVLKISSLLIGFAIIWLAYEASLLLQKRKIKKIDMVEALKENRRNE